MNTKILTTNLEIIKLDRKKFTAYFCQNLLRYSEIKCLFGQNRFRLRESKLLAILFLIVRNLENKNELKKLFNLLLSQYLAIEILIYAPIVRDAFLKALESYLGELKPEIAAAWTEAYDLILNLVLEDRSKNGYFNWESPEFIDNLNRIRLEILAKQTWRSIPQTTKNHQRRLKLVERNYSTKYLQKLTLNKNKANIKN